MGRRSTGAWSVYDALRLDIKGFLEHFKSGEDRSLIVHWGEKHSIRAKVCNSCTMPSLELSFLFGGEPDRVEVNQVILVDSVPSNLGRGEIHYWRCPYTGERVKYLYSAYGAGRFMSRRAYEMRGLRLYYPNQLSSKLYRLNQRYFALEERVIPQLRAKRKRKTYAGKPTKQQLALDKAYRELERIDEMRWSVEYLPKSLLKFLVSNPEESARSGFTF